MKQTLSYGVRNKSDYRRSVISYSLATLLIATFFFISCKKTNEDVPQPQPTYHLNVSSALVQSPSSAGTNTKVTIDANAEWKIALPAGTDWLEVNKTSGTGNDSIQLKVTKENNTGAKRTAVITISLINGKAQPRQISVEQDFSVITPITLAWQKVLGGNGNDYGYSIIKATDGGYLLSGRTTSNNGDITSTKGGIDMWVAKLDAAGSITWQKTYGGNADEYSVAAANTSDGGYVLTGFTLSNNNGDVGANHGNTDFWVLKINSTGTIQWQKTLGGTGDDRPNAITVTSEGNIGVTGYTTSNNNGDVGINHGGQDMWVLLIDNNTGDILTKKTFGGNGDESGKAIAPAPDGGLYVGGNTTSNNNGDVSTTKGGSDFWVLHLDKNLSIIWKNSFGGTNNEDINSLVVGPNTTLIASGSTKSSGTGDVAATKGGEDMWVLQINSTTGMLGWQKTFGGANGEVAKSALVKANGNIVVAGWTYSNNSGDVDTNHGAGEFWILGLSNNGNLSWKKAFGGDNEDLAYSIAEAADGVIIAGATMSKSSGDVGAGLGNSDVWLVKLKDQ
ncbi:MAG: BACON domain-containing protein [Chitinophagaceae bacterium]